MPKLPSVVAEYISAQPEPLQPALHEIYAMLAKTYPKAMVEMYATGAGDLPAFMDGDKFLGGFSVRAKGPMVYLGDSDVVAAHKAQLGSLAAGNAACVLYKPTKTLDAAALKSVFEKMFAEIGAKK
jgi:uncharacterized protein YdhG (YjbR/CyaY superfamily)